MKVATRSFIGIMAFTCAVAAGGRSAPSSGDALVARGEYLVGNAGRCGDCHGAALHGGPVGILRPGLPGFAYKAPAIAGLPELSTAAANRFLRTGMLPNGKTARPPMPAYRFAPSDAAAIVAYLKSLP